jgi:hypothetical protein
MGSLSCCLPRKDFSFDIIADPWVVAQFGFLLQGGHPALSQAGEPAPSEAEGDLPRIV